MPRPPPPPPRYHPDKNPAGRAQFLAVQAAYERLQAGAAGGQGPQGWRIELMLRAQCILFKRWVVTRVVNEWSNGAPMVDATSSHPPPTSKTRPTPTYLQQLAQPRPQVRR